VKQRLGMVPWPAATADEADDGLAILKRMYDLSYEVLCGRPVENPFFRYFSGEK
jgi:hypothetical protein